MNLYEYEAKTLLNIFNIPILNSYFTKKKYYIKNRIYKIQVYSGYRKKNNGILYIENFNDFLLFFKKWNNSYFLKNKINGFLIEKFISFNKELYISFFISNDFLIFLLSDKGGINIELGQKKDFLKIKINVLIISFSIFDYLANCLIKNTIIKKIIKIIFNLYLIVFYKQIVLVEINPIIIIKNNIYILDCKIILNKITKINFSNNISDFLKINYVQLKGKICCIVNGAGLALETMDKFCYFNKKCFSFIDLSGSITNQQLNFLFNFIITKKKILILFINLFGGIVSCIKILNSLLNLMYLDFNFKIIIRMDGSFSNYSKKSINYFKNLLIIEDSLKCIYKCITLSYV
ncbi:ATP-grasp domain-containing protein [Candidatus Carsonella ruddii]|uniref:ATP-grasp domain-containing protein n=1 Tax=Carsonella ruddii TaxID=114186 RepID=UPI003D819E9F